MSFSLCFHVNLDFVSRPFPLSASLSLPTGVTVGQRFTYTVCLPPLTLCTRVSAVLQAVEVVGKLPDCPFHLQAKLPCPQMGVWASVFYSPTLVCSISDLVYFQPTLYGDVQELPMADVIIVSSIRQESTSFHQANRQNNLHLVDRLVFWFGKGHYWF